MEVYNSTSSSTSDVPNFYKRHRRDTIISIDPIDDHAVHQIMDFTLLVDHLVEKILSNLDVRTLKNCRLVSHRWAHFSSKQLQNKVTVSFSLVHTDLTYYSHRLHSIEKKEPLEDLTELMKSSVLTLFPFTTFKFYLGHLLIPSLQTFLNSHGSHLIKLEVHLNNFTEKPETLTSLYTHLRNLIVYQAPNLKYLKLQIEVDHLEIMEEIEDIDDVSEFEQQLQLLSFSNSLETFQENQKCVGFNYKLKYLKFLNGVPQRLFESLINLAPNLMEVTLPVGYYNYFVEPSSLLITHHQDQLHQANGNNSINFLRNFCFLPNEENIDLYEKILGSVNQQHKRVKLRKLTLNFEDLYLNCNCKEIMTMSDEKELESTSKSKLVQRVTLILNKLLQDNADSLEKLVLMPLGFLKAVRIPQMKKVRQIELCNVYYNQLTDQHFFPKGTSIQNVFPNLKGIRFSSSLITNSFHVGSFMKHALPHYFHLDTVDTFDVCKINDNEETDCDWNSVPFLVCESVTSVSLGNSFLQEFEQCVKVLSYWFPNAKFNLG